tara:strand:+ start:121 stop:399 length:279 start_codon:yes stop_codon:yes gene_type:complete
MATRKFRRNKRKGAGIYFSRSINNNENIVMKNTREKLIKDLEKTLAFLKNEANEKKNIKYLDDQIKYNKIAIKNLERSRRSSRGKTKKRKVK